MKRSTFVFYMAKNIRKIYTLKHELESGLKHIFLQVKSSFGHSYDETCSQQKEKSKIFWHKTSHSRSQKMGICKMVKNSPCQQSIMAMEKSHIPVTTWLPVAIRNVCGTHLHTCAVSTTDLKSKRNLIENCKIVQED